MRRGIALGLVAALAACSQRSDAGAKASSSSSPPPTDSSASDIKPLAGGAPDSPNCPATGLWAQCSVLYRLGRAGVIPQFDSTEKVEEKTLTGKSFVVKIGTNARLELFLYPDSAARKADVAKLDRKQFVAAEAAQTIARERTLIENANLVGLLTSLNDKLRERVSDALTAGAPQPHKSQAPK